MISWILQGLKTGIRTSGWPSRDDAAAGLSPGRPAPSHPTADVATVAALCPTGALLPQGDSLAVDRGRCVHCLRCAGLVPWQPDYQWAWAPGGAEPGLGVPFRRSAHVLVVDTGDCGACLHEVKQLDNPYYSFHRLGLFITPTPRQADILLVVGALVDHMRVPLQKAYDAMPTPRRVVAVGACALSGGVFGPSFMGGTGIGDFLPVDVAVPGQPPPPLAILHGLLVAVGQLPPAPPWSTAEEKPA